MLKITHFNFDHYMKQRARFYDYTSKLILEIEDCAVSYCLKETVNIAGIEYEIGEVIHYPTVNYVDYIIDEINKED